MIVMDLKEGGGKSRPGQKQVCLEVNFQKPSNTCQHVKIDVKPMMIKGEYFLF